MKKSIALITLICVIISSGLQAQTPLWQGKGRIAISSDGNEHDHDDWAATAFSLALLASQGLQDKLVLYTYSDHVWGSNLGYRMSRGMSAYEHMRESALGGKERFGFDKSNFICAVDNPTRAYDEMAKVINQSSEDNPLFIIAGGPMEVVGEALKRSEKSKRKYVKLISHSWWNNLHSDKPEKWEEQHTGWTLQDIKDAYATEEGGSLQVIDILDQNGGKDYEGLAAPMEKFNWVLASPAQNKKQYKTDSWYWLYSRLTACSRNAHFDASDAGMVIYLLTGIQKTNPELARIMMENPVGPTLAPMFTTKVDVKKDGGIVIGDEFIAIKPDATKSPLGNWKIRKAGTPEYDGIISVLPAMGEYFLEYEGDVRGATPPGKDVLEYKFTPKTSGAYTLTGRMAQRLNNGNNPPHAGDLCNDIYIKMLGDKFTSGNDTPLEVLKNFNKFYGNGRDSWGIFFKIDVNHKKYTATYNLKKGVEYTLQVAGRSGNCCIDYFLLTQAPVNLNEIADLAKAVDKRYRPQPEKK